MKSAHPSPSFRRQGPRGQALVLTVLMMLFVTVTVFLTFAIGARTRRKIHIQSVADATAYSLAVAEARAFNFYAWSNRAIVAHNVSLLSVHAHTSYLSFYEDVLAATANNYRIMAQRADADTADVLNRIAAMYQDSDFVTDADGSSHQCEWQDDPNNPPTYRKCSLDLSCSGNGTCDTDISNRVRGAEFFHNQWHAKINSNSCYRLVEASRDHFRKVELLRAQQLAVEAELVFMMTGNTNEMLSPDDARVVYSTREGHYRDFRSDIPTNHDQSLANQLAKLSDPRFTAERLAGIVTRRAYRRAVHNGLEGNEHQDYDEILAGTRFPDFISQRGFQEDRNWIRLRNKARRMAAPLDLEPVTEVRSEGTARLIKLRGIREDPGQWSDRPGPLVDAWPPIYRNMPNPPPNARPRPRYEVPRSGAELADRAHDHRRDVRYGDGDGIVAEDHGWVETRVGGMRERTVIDEGRNAVWGDPHDYNGPDAHVPIPGDNTTHSNHIFHADMMRVPGHGISMGASDTPLSNGEQRGVYRGHMRYKLVEDEDELWNMPRTLTFITTPVPQRRTWDFEFTVWLPRPVSFTTINSIGDTGAGRTMAAFAGGLVYFHKPPNSDEEYGEPPNLWNPFWRAKLHPVRYRDALEASPDHSPTQRALLALDGYPTVNY